MTVPGDYKENFNQLKRVCEELMYSQSGDRDKVMEIDRLAHGVDYMDIPRRAMRRHFDRYETLKQRAKKDEAWARVRDEIYRLHTFASTNFQSSD